METISEPKTIFKSTTAEAVPMSESMAQRVLAAWCAAADIADDAWPLTSDDAVRLLQAGQYAVDLPSLEDLGDRGQLPACELWDARDIVAAASALEARRQWSMVPSVHDEKKTETRLALELNLQIGPDAIAAMRQTLKPFDLRFALILLVESDSREMREKLFSTVTAILRADFGVEA